MLIGTVIATCANDDHMTDFQVIDPRAKARQLAEQEKGKGR
jgi:hypothetical protein